MVATQDSGKAIVGGSSPKRTSTNAISSDFFESAGLGGVVTGEGPRIVILKVDFGTHQSLPDSIEIWFAMRLGRRLIRRLTRVGSLAVAWAPFARTGDA